MSGHGEKRQIIFKPVCQVLRGRRSSKRCDTPTPRRRGLRGDRERIQDSLFRIKASKALSRLVLKFEGRRVGLRAMGTRPSRALFYVCHFWAQKKKNGQNTELLRFSGLLLAMQTCPSFSVRDLSG